MKFSYLEVTHIDKVEFFHDKDRLPITYSLVITFICNSNKANHSEGAKPYNVVVKFADVRSFKFEPKFSDGVGAVQVFGFDIVDISDRQWDAMKYMIEDFEHGQMNFYCRSYEVIA